MQSTASLSCLDTLTDENRTHLLADTTLRSLVDVFATLPGPRSVMSPLDDCVIG